MFSAPVDGAREARAEANAGFTLDSFDPTLCTDDIDDVHIPQISDDAGSQGEWDPNEATSSAPFLRQQPPHGLSSPITSSLRTALADTQESTYEDSNRPGSSAQARDMARSGGAQLAAAQPSTVAAAQQSQQQCQYSQLQHQPQPDIMPSQLAEAPVVEAAAGPLPSVTCSDHPPADPSCSSAAQAAPRASGYHEQPASPGVLTSSHARQQPAAMLVSSPNVAMQGFSHSQHVCMQIGAAACTQYGRTAEQIASSPQSQQNMAASNVYHTQGLVPYPKKAFQQSFVQNSQTQNCVDSSQNQQPAQPGPVQRTHQGSVSVVQFEQLQLESLSREDRLSREKGLDMMQQGSPISWVAFASELITKQGSPCRWCRHPIRVGDKIWHECKCGKRKGNGWCCKNQPWEHAYCALVSRVPSPAYPPISSPAGTNAHIGVSAPACPSAPAGVAASMSPSAPGDVTVSISPSTHLCGNAAADGSSQQVHAQTRAVEFERRLTGPELNPTRGLAECGDRLQTPVSSIQVSQPHPPLQYLHAQQTASGQLHPVSGQQPLASGQLQSAPGQLQAGQAHQHAAPGHLQPAAGQLEIVRPHMQPLSQLASYIDLTSPTQTMSHSQPRPHSQSQPGSQVLSHCLGVDRNGISIQAKREAALKRQEDSQRRRALASQLQSHSQTDPQSQSMHSTPPEQASLSQNSSQPSHTQSDTTPGSAPLAWSGSASGSGLGSGSKSTYGSPLGSNLGSSLPLQVSSPQMHTPPKQLPQSDPPCWHSPSLSPHLSQPAVRLLQSLSPPSQGHHQSLVDQHQLHTHSQQQSFSHAQPQSLSQNQHQPLSQPQFGLPSQLQHQSSSQVQLHQQQQQQQHSQPPFWSSAQATAQATAQGPAQALSSWSPARSPSQPAAQPASWAPSQQLPMHLPSQSRAQAAAQSPAGPSAAMPDWSSAGQQQQQQQLSQSGGVWEAEATGSQGNDSRKRSHDIMTAGQGTSVVLFDDKGRSISEKREAAQKRLRASLARRGIPYEPA